MASVSGELGHCFESLVGDVAHCATKLTFVESRNMLKHCLMHEVVRTMMNEMSQFRPGMDQTFLSRKVWG